MTSRLGCNSSDDLLANNLPEGMDFGACESGSRPHGSGQIQPDRALILNLPCRSVLLRERTHLRNEIRRFFDERKATMKALLCIELRSPIFILGRNLYDTFDAHALV